MIFYLSSRVTDVFNILHELILKIISSNIEHSKLNIKCKTH